LFHPARTDVLRKVLANFRPGIPLTLTDVAYSTLFALWASTLVVWPLRRLQYRKQLRRVKLQSAS
jgi:hypothetical protein